jgi:hypothetical protein
MMVKIILEPVQAERLVEALAEIVEFKFFMKERKDYKDYKELLTIICNQIHACIQNHKDKAR